MKFDPKAILRHVAGATVSHRSRFSDLPVRENKTPVSKEFIDMWVLPFYRKPIFAEEFSSAYIQKRKELSDEVIDCLLGEFNWRMKKVGALFAAIEGRETCVEQVGNLLLRSEVCFAGRSYATALASLNRESCPEYLDRYLSYYLKREDLDFDQSEVLAALIHLDEKRGENRHEAHMSEWERFTANKTHKNLERSITLLSTELDAIETLKAEPDESGNG